MKIGEFFIDILLNILIVVCLIFLLIVSIPIAIVYIAFTVIYKISGFISSIIKKIWMDLMDGYKKMLEVYKD